MIDSDITGITTDCHELPQKPEAIDAHPAGCVCDCCCQFSESDCQDNIEQDVESSGGMKSRMKKMRSKSTPMITNCAVLLAILVLAGVTARASNILGVDILDIHDTNYDQIAIAADVIGRVDIEVIGTRIAKRSDLAIARANEIAIINGATLQNNISDAISLIGTAETNNPDDHSVLAANSIERIAIVDGYITHTIVS